MKQKQTVYCIVNTNGEEPDWDKIEALMEEVTPGQKVQAIKTILKKDPTAMFVGGFK